MGSDFTDFVLEANQMRQIRKPNLAADNTPQTFISMSRSHIFERLLHVVTHTRLERIHSQHGSWFAGEGTGGEGKRESFCFPLSVLGNKMV